MLRLSGSGSRRHGPPVLPAIARAAMNGDPPAGGAGESPFIGPGVRPPAARLIAAAAGSQFERVAGDLADGVVRGVGRDGRRRLADRHIADQERRSANGAVTSSKLGAAAVGTSALASNAVTSSKVADGSLTAGDIAPNTFLPATGTAADSSKLGGVAPNGYLQGTGKLRSARLSLAPATGATEFLELDFGHISGICDPGVSGKVRFVADLPIDNLIVWTTNSGGTVDIQTSNALTAGSFYEQPHTGGLPQSVTIQAAYNDASHEQIATAWVTNQTAGGQCVFTGQAITTL